MYVCVSVSLCSLPPSSFLFGEMAEQIRIELFPFLLSGPLVTLRVFFLPSISSRCSFSSCIQSLFQTLSLLATSFRVCPLFPISLKVILSIYWLLCTNIAFGTSFFMALTALSICHLIHTYIHPSIHPPPLLLVLIFSYERDPCPPRSSSSSSRVSFWALFCRSVFFLGKYSPSPFSLLL